MILRVLLFILFVFSTSHTYAQQILSVTSNTGTSTPTPDIDVVYYGNRNEPPRAITFNEKSIIASAFITNINHHLTLPAEFTFIETESNTDFIGMHHRLLQQYYKGIPMEGLGYRAHERNGFITSINGRAVRNISLDTQTSINEEQAFYLAIESLHTKDTVFRHGKKLIVSKNFTFTPESFSIAFQFDIDVSLIERWRISIDARTGQVVNKISLVNTCFNEEEPNHKKKTTPLLPYGTGTGLTNYYGNQTILVEKFEDGSTVMIGQTDNGVTLETYDFRNVSVIALALGFPYKVYRFYSSDSTFTSNYTKPAVSVQWAAEQSVKYYLKNHGRNSYDNNGAAIKSYVHVDQNMNNAFWTGRLLAFGDGNNNNPLVELDVVGHELTHGVTQHEANLQYYLESGALNESFSDIFGKAIEFATFGDTATWQLARHNRDGGLRDFSNPNLKSQPDTYFGDLWYDGYDDNGGVHYNSGVQNFWFYLLCEGGSGVNDHQFSYSVNPIGIEAATNIAYRNLTEYLSNTSDYLDSRIGSMLATSDLYGKNSNVYQEVDKAWDAVGVIDEPIIINLDLYDITATTVKFKGSLLPRGDTVTYHLEYGTTLSFGESSAIYNYTDKVEGIVTGLQSQTKYHVRLVATNENGSTYFAAESFTTISLAPLVRIKQTIDVTETTATLHGEINPNSLPTSFYFEYGSTPALGSVTSIYSLSDTTEFLNVSASISNLQPRQTYYYMVVATNGFASSVSESASFFTAVKPVISSYSPTTAPVGTEVTLEGQNFNLTKEKNLVSFGATRARVLSSSLTEIKVEVPEGASLAPLTLLDAESGLIAESVQEFVPTFIGEFKKNSLQLRYGINDIGVSQTLVEDMDGDGRPDIVTRNYPGFSVLQNVNNGGDITEESFVRNSFTAPDLTGSLFLVDIDGNGLKDIVSRVNNGLKVYPNFSVPGYIFFGVPVDLPIGYYSRVIFNDFDQDGHTDFALFKNGANNSTLINIYRNKNPKGFISIDNFHNQYSIELPYDTDNWYSDDLNNDGKPELVASAYGQSLIPILINNSQIDVFAFIENIIPDSTRGRNTRYILQDFNQDGWKDVVSCSLYDTGYLTIFENINTSPEISMTKPIDLGRYYAPYIIQPGDIDGDGKVDIILGTERRNFFLLNSNIVAEENISNTSFEKNGVYGMELDAYGTVHPQITINDLNGDGRPEIINSYIYYFGPHDGYQMEIWQNSFENNCLDPSLIGIDVNRTYAALILPPNATLDQFEIEMYYPDSDKWYQLSLSSTTLYLSPGQYYEIRIRAKCYLGYTEYHYLNFVSECVDISSFVIGAPSIDQIELSASRLSSFEVQHSPAGKNQWTTLSEYSNRITNLLPGTTYDLRFRGRCPIPGDFKYRQFTTLCPQLSNISIAKLNYNKAVASWTSNYAGTAIIEYSSNNIDWSLADETNTMSPLTPGQKYYVRGRLACTNINSDFIYTSFITPCPKASMLRMDSVTPFNAIINWIDESNTHNYTIKYFMNTVGQVTTVETNSTSFKLEDLTPGTDYTVMVAPQCISDPDFTPITFSTICYSPFNLSSSNITYSSAELTWNDNFNGVPYAVDYSISGSGLWLTAETPLNNILLANLRPGTEYEARVHINCLNITEPFISLRFKTNLYEETTFAPNPTYSTITIYPSKNLIGNRFSIFNITGKQVAHGELLDYTLDFSIFSEGIYLLKIEGEKIMKIIKH